MSRWWFTMVLLGCAPAEEDTEDTGSDDNGVECGDPVTYDIEVTAKVVERDGTPVRDIDVFIDDRGWEYDFLGSGQTNERGLVTFMAYGVTSLDGCWGTVLNYWVVAIDATDHERTAEDDMNTELYNAIDNGSLAADVSDFPLEL